MTKKKNKKDDIEFDFEASAVGKDGELSEVEVLIYKQMLDEASARVQLYEKFLLDRGLMEEANSSFVSDEEMICTQGIEYIKRLVLHGTFTKDDINAFDVLHRNLCLIRGITIDRKKSKREVPKGREELLKLINTAKG